MSCKFCGSTTDLVHYLSMTEDHYRCPSCLNQPEDFHRNPKKPEQDEITEA